LAEVADRLSGFDFVLGGSAMLEAHGISVEVGDLDLVMEPDARLVLDPAPWPSAGPVAPLDPFCSDWILRFQIGGVQVDCIGGLRIRAGERVIGFPVHPVGSMVVEGREIPLADPADWYHLYLAYRPERAEAIAAVWDRRAISDSARRLGIDRVIG
jgi:hypothetical protein